MQNLFHPRIDLATQSRAGVDSSLVLSLDPNDIPPSRGWSVLPVFENPQYGEAYLDTLRQMEKDPSSPGLSDVGIRNLLFAHILTLRPQSVLEIGTHIGTGSVIIAQALKLNGFGKLCSIEPAAHYRELALKYIKQAGLEAWAEVIEGYSSDSAVHEYLSTKAPFELIFVDANHNYTAVKEEIEWCWQLLAGNGLMIFHDSGIHAVDFDSKREGGVRRALTECSTSMEGFRLLAYEWPLWLNPCGAAVVWKRPVSMPVPIG